MEWTFSVTLHLMLIFTLNHGIQSGSVDSNEVKKYFSLESEGHHCQYPSGAALKNDAFLAQTQEMTNNVSKMETIVNYLCKKCFFPQNCLSNNTCLAGTEGEGCEKCVSGYVRVGNTCYTCTDIPWRPIGLVICLVVLSVGFALNGVTVSYCTKVKLLFDFLQILELSQHLKIAWPPLLLEVTSIMAFINMNSNSIIPGCIFKTASKNLHYFEWLTSLSIPAVILFIGLIVDKKMTGNQEKDSNQRNTVIMKRLQVRRFLYVVLVIMYVPVAVSTVHNLSCSTNIPLDWSKEITKDVFLYDYDMNCEKFLYQVFNLISTIYLCVYVIAFPLFLILFALRQRKWGLLDVQFKSYGFAHESYKNMFCFWEAIPLIRKGVTIAITDTFMFSTFIQATVLIGMTGVWFVLTVLCRPYRKFTWKGCGGINIHVVFEMLATLCIGVVQVRGLLITKGIMVEILDTVSVVAIGVVIAFWIFISFITRLEKEFDEFELYHDEESEEMAPPKPSTTKIFSKKNKVGITLQTKHVVKNLEF